MQQPVAKSSGLLSEETKESLYQIATSMTVEKTPACRNNLYKYSCHWERAAGSKIASSTRQLWLSAEERDDTGVTVNWILDRGSCHRETGNGAKEKASILRRGSWNRQLHRERKRQLSLWRGFCHWENKQPLEIKVQLSLKAFVTGKITAVRD
jgi:hypothetical protein